MSGSSLARSHKEGPRECVVEVKEAGRGFSRVVECRHVVDGVHDTEALSLHASCKVLCREGEGVGPRLERGGPTPVRES